MDAGQLLKNGLRTIAVCAPCGFRAGACIVRVRAWVSAREPGRCEDHVSARDADRRPKYDRSCNTTTSRNRSAVCGRSSIEAYKLRWETKAPSGAGGLRRWRWMTLFVGPLPAPRQIERVRCSHPRVRQSPRCCFRGGDPTTRHIPWPRFRGSSPCSPETAARCTFLRRLGHPVNHGIPSACGGDAALPHRCSFALERRNFPGRRNGFLRGCLAWPHGCLAWPQPFPSRLQLPVPFLRLTTYNMR